MTVKLELKGWSVFYANILKVLSEDKKNYVLLRDSSTGVRSYLVVNVPEWRVFLNYYWRAGVYTSMKSEVLHMFIRHHTEVMMSDSEKIIKVWVEFRTRENPTCIMYGSDE